jgi:hypothetical protein
VRGSGLSLSFVESHKRDRPKKPDEPDLRHAPRNVGLQDLTLILVRHSAFASTGYNPLGRQTGKQRPQPRLAYRPRSEDEGVPGGNQKSSLSPFSFPAFAVTGSRLT